MRALSLLVMGITLALGAGCARDDPEAGLEEAIKRPLEKAESVEQTLKDSAESRLQELDGEN
ncbi:hypothetical protein FV139_10205 [Parahaliea maris]|uniref:Uncharacterized protein n=1 Tax=Parahaliea maris TaxID=2716870 RepID=A0A5C8ZZQ7_9GAMM|nr:hypothetical protein [Parahaliea maris]TXS93986.1 hypothetical protein FV139_10205 [Parahaliea maris]